MKFDNLRTLRESLRLTQEQFAGSLGLSKTTYNGYETGARDPKSTFWCAVADKYGVTVDFLLGMSNAKAPSTVSDEGLNDEDYNVANAYHNADDGVQFSVRKLLDVEMPSSKNSGKVG